MTHRFKLFSVLSVVALLGAVLFLPASGQAGGFSWSQEKISTPVGQFGVPVSSYFSPPQSRSSRGVTPGLGSQITRVQVQWAHQARVPVHAKLCWADMSLCIPVTLSSTTTDAFNGRDARGPLVMVYTAIGKGRLPRPVFVRASVSVWFDR